MAGLVNALVIDRTWSGINIGDKKEKLSRYDDASNSPCMVRLQRETDDNWFAFFDPVENVHARITCHPSADPEPFDRDGFPITVDYAIRIFTRRITIDTVPEVTVRKPNGRTIPPRSSGESDQYERGAYLIEISTPLKLYVSLDAPITVTPTACSVTLDFSSAVSVTVGARVPRDRPRHTVRTTRDVADLFPAVSTFGSSIQTWGPERSYPSLRGHPPQLDVGDSLDIPEEVTPPETGVQLELPATPMSAAVAAPLAYYLGARLIPAEKPRLIANGEPVSTLDAGRPIGRQCAQLLERFLFLDCLARQRWEYDITLTERERITAKTGIEWTEIARIEYPERLHRYAAISPAMYRDEIPNWQRRATVVPSERGIRSLPYLAFDLIGLREHTHRLPSPSHHSARVSTDGGAILARGGPSNSPTTDSFVWDTIGRQAPIGLNRVYPTAFENRLERGIDREAISIAVVCNDKKMAAELESVWSVYDQSEDPFVTVHRYENLSCDELLAVLAKPTDYFHYIGHIEDRGFECTDGWFDATNVEEVRVESCFLNACSSMTQAIGLIEAGVSGAIATEARVLNKAAVRMGEQLATLLARGFPIGVSLALVRPNGGIGHQYTVLGDPTLAIAQAESGIPYFCEVISTGSDRYELWIESALTSLARVGSACTFRVKEGMPYYLSPTRQRFSIDRDTLERFLDLESVPVMTDGKLRWSDESLDRIVSPDHG